MIRHKGGVNFIDDTVSDTKNRNRNKKLHEIKKQFKWVQNINLTASASVAWPKAIEAIIALWEVRQEKGQNGNAKFWRVKHASVRIGPYLSHIS